MHVLTDDWNTAQDKYWLVHLLHTIQIQNFFEGVSDKLVVQSSIKQDVNVMIVGRLQVATGPFAITVNVRARLQVWRELILITRCH